MGLKPEAIEGLTYRSLERRYAQQQMLGAYVVVTEADGRLERVLEGLRASGRVVKAPQFGRVGIGSRPGGADAERVEDLTVADV